MLRPDFGDIRRHAEPKQPRLRGPQAVQPSQRLYRCECCNDTGIVEAWKLNKFAFPNWPKLNHNSNPIFCHQFNSCGDLTLQVFAEDKPDKDNGESRTETINLFSTPKKESTTILKKVGDKQLKMLSKEQSKYIHDSVLEYRAQLSTGTGQAWVEQSKKACREALPVEKPRGNGSLEMFELSIDLPPEPDFDIALEKETVEIRPDPKDFDEVLPPSNAPTQAPEKLPITLETDDFCPW